MTLASQLDSFHYYFVCNVSNKMVKCSVRRVYLVSVPAAWCSAETELIYSNVLTSPLISNRLWISSRLWISTIGYEAVLNYYQYYHRIYTRPVFELRISIRLVTALFSFRRVLRRTGCTTILRIVPCTQMMISNCCCCSNGLYEFSEICTGWQGSRPSLEEWL